MCQEVANNWRRRNACFQVERLGHGFSSIMEYCTQFVAVLRHARSWFVTFHCKYISKSNVLITKQYGSLTSHAIVQKGIKIGHNNYFSFDTYYSITNNNDVQNCHYRNLVIGLDSEPNQSSPHVHNC